MAPTLSFLMLLGCGVEARRFMDTNLKVQVRVPSADRRKYAHSILDSGLVHLAVEDPKAAKSGFAVSVSAGSYYDPESLPGLAHFCEHLLFLGTEKYPDESSFDTYLNQHDGSNNAYTEQEETVFYNEISHAGFDEGMDRFAQFFIAPLFKAELVGRELEAVNSEHSKNIPDQFRKMWELMRGTAGSSSVVGHFYTGTTESLHHGDNTTVAALKKYHEENYCAPRMRLITVSNRTVAEQQTVAKTHFEAVPQGAGKCSPTPRDFVKDTPFADASRLGRFLHLRTDAVPTLWMMFPMEPTSKQYKSQPGAMLTYFLGYAGPGSLKSQLKELDLVSELSVDVDQSSAATLVFLMFDLTAYGTAHVGDVTSLVLEYLEKVRTEGEAHIQAVYSSMQQMSKVTFDFQEAPDSVMDSVSGLASSMQTYAPEDVLSGDMVIDTPDVGFLSELFARFTPSNMNLALATKDFDENKADRYNKYYKAKYTDAAIPAAMLHKKADKTLGVPPALRFVPADLSTSTATAGKIPERLANDGAEVWWLGKGRFSLPKAQIRARLSLPKTMPASPRLSAMRKLHVELTVAALEQPLEDLGNCGMSLDVDQDSQGYHFSMNGYSQHLSALAVQAAEGFAAPRCDQKRFEQARQKLVDGLEDPTSKMPYEHGMQALSVVTSSGAFSTEDVVRELKAIDVAAFKAYLGELSAKGVRVELLSTGNMNKTVAQSFADTFVSNLQIRHVLRKEEATQPQVLEVARGVEVRLPNPIPGDANSATINAYQYGVPDVAQRVRLLMLSKMINSPIYDELRTKQQLGYVVDAAVMAQRHTMQLSVIVQGEKESPDEVDGRIEAVLDDFGHSLKSLSAPEFARWKASIRSAIDQDDQNMGQEADRLWDHIADGEECFNRKELALEFLDSFSDATELANLAKEYAVFRNAPHKISIRLFGNHSLVGEPQPTTALQVLQGDNSSQKWAAYRGQSFFPAAGMCQIHRSA